MRPTPFMAVLALACDDAEAAYFECPAWRIIRRRRLQRKWQALSAACWIEKRALDRDREFGAQTRIIRPR